MGIAYATWAAGPKSNVCRLVRLAAKRTLDMLEMAKDPRNDFVFSTDHVVDYCHFQEQLEHTESGMWEFNAPLLDDGLPDPRIYLEPWQCWIEMHIHGFRKRRDGTRLVTRSYEEEPRKSAKSERLAGAALYDLCCSGQRSPQIVLGASTEEQANRVFSPVSKICAAVPEIVAKWKLKITSKRISLPGQDEDGISKLSSMGERQDGLNPSLAILDEGHAGAQSVYNVIRSAMGARPNALLRMITTAGYRKEGPAWEMRKEIIKLLTTAHEDYSVFGAIYTLDEEDYLDKTKMIQTAKLLRDQRLMEKANPMWEISLSPDLIMQQATEARANPTKLGEFLRTRYNIWTAAGSSLIQPQYWGECYDPKLSIADFIGPERRKCWVGVDLAEKLDMCAVVALFEMPGDRLALFSWFYLPELSKTATHPELAGMIQAWASGGHLYLTPGALADHDRVRRDIEGLCEYFDVQMVGCDPRQAHNTIKHLWDSNIPVMSYGNSAATMTAPTDDLIARVTARTLVHDGNPVMAWCVENTFGERKPDGTIMPRKVDPNSYLKIDGMVAGCMANGVRLNPELVKEVQKKIEDPYLERGIIGYTEAHDA